MLSLPFASFRLGIRLRALDVPATSDPPLFFMIRFLPICRYDK